MTRPGEPPRTRVWAMDVPRGEARARSDSLLERAKASGAEVLVLDGGMVFGADQVRSALAHAEKAVEEGRNSSDSLLMETLLYASGERQLSSAIRKMSPGDETDRLVLAVLRGHFEPGRGWSEVPGMEPGPDTRRLLRFGISEAELATVDEARLADLVLERVAAVDVIKR